MEEKKNNEVVSVALREALERGYEKWYAAGCHESGCGCVTAYIEREIAALSLSSPIEPSEQITKLANFIMAEIDGEPSQSEGAVDCAIRLLSAMNQRIQILERKAQASSEVREALTELCSIWEAEKEMEEPTERSKWYEMALRRCAGDVRRALAPSRQGATK